MAEWEAAIQSITLALWPESLRRAVWDYDSLYIVPWDELWNVPFAALPGLDGRAVVLEKTVSLLPSVQFLSREQDGSGIADDDICVIAYDSAASDGNELNLGPAPTAKCG